jgi:uncharacterized protein (DUF2384 family)
MKSYQFSALRMALVVFGDTRKVRSWMHKPKKAFGDKSAFEVMETAEGCELVKELLNQIDHGLCS